jgi:hypothetical protein
MKTYYESLFHTGWFVESILTQTLIVHIIRTPRTVANIARKDVEKGDHTVLARFGSVFRLFWD